MQGAGSREAAEVESAKQSQLGLIRFKRTAPGEEKRRFRGESLPLAP